MSQQSQAASGQVWPPSPSTYNYPGAKWWKMDFHTHTPESDDYAGREQDATVRAALKQQTPESWLKNQMEAGLDAVAVTDHNSTGFISRLQTAYASLDKNDASFRPLVIFPGFELSVNGGLHLLAIFDPQRNLDDISGVITACGYRGTRGKTDDGVCSQSFENCIKIIKDHDGLAIAAHIDEACGLLWNKLTIGEEIRALMRTEQLSHEAALDRLISEQRLVATVRDDGQKVNQTVEDVLSAGLDAIEARSWTTLPATIQGHSVLGRLARVTGSDSHMPSDIGRNGFSLVHMTRPNLAGLRMAFADGSAVRPHGGSPIIESWSVRPISKTDTRDSNVWPDQALEKISISQIKTGGRVNPLEMPLHPRLNVLVGGRGSGKSTFVHALRLASHRGRELPRYENDVPVRESPAGDFWRWAQIPAAGRGQDGVILGNASVIKLLYRSPAQAAELYWQASFLGQGTNSSPPTVRVGDLGVTPTNDGGAYSASRFPLSIYSQKQVLEMSRGPSGLMEIIDREQNVAALEEHLKQVVATYSATKAKIRELNATLANEAQETATLNDILAELEKIQSDAVKEHQRRQAQARVLLPNLEPDSPLLILARELNERADRIFLPDLLGEPTQAPDASFVAANELYQTAQRELNSIAAQIRLQASAIQTALTTLDQNLRGSAWFKDTVDAKAAYDAVLGTQTTAFDPARLTKLGQQTVAVLSFLLSFGTEPLVLDQPEDDLDTRMIISLIVEQVRRMKEHRQIIIVTHNPNIVVHGDADLVHAMVDQAGQVHRDADASGGLQDKPTRKFICDVMEGGAIAFRKRFDRMGREEA